MAITINLTASLLSKDEARAVVAQVFDENFGSMDYQALADEIVERLHIVTVG